LKNGNEPIKLSTNQETRKDPKATNSSFSKFYSIQIAAFKVEKTSDDYFFREQPFDFEKQIDNLYKYFIGRFETMEKAKKELEKIKLKYKDAFIVLFKNGEVQ
jgi:hypothetical protein